MQDIITALESAEAQLAQLKKALDGIDVGSAGPLLKRTTGLAQSVEKCREDLQGKKKSLFEGLCSVLLNTGYSPGLPHIVGVWHKEDENHKIGLWSDHVSITYGDQDSRIEKIGTRETLADRILLPGNTEAFYQFCKIGMKAVERFLMEGAPKQIQSLKSEIGSLNDVVGQIPRLIQMLDQKAA